jgi:methionyl-tRNA formyltransferase
MKITIITDDIKSWFIPYGTELLNQLTVLGHQVSYVHSKQEILEGDVCFILSCTKLLENDYLLRNKNNIVVHASDLPAGRGWSPLQWQVMEGKDTIPLTMIEAAAGADEGPYYLKSSIRLDGTELLPEMRNKMALEIIKMCTQYAEQRDKLMPIEQVGDSTFYPRRNNKDDEVDIDKTVRELFSQLRVADNDRHPLYFYYLANKYIIKIYKQTDPK